ncbi:MAG: hypothetical protein HY279_00595 [Nitrospinae bacterium]|nr:hypothetical protein [Nitrospinota bacterium]
MCKISNKVFNLKEGFIEPHHVEILLSSIYGKCYARILVGNDKHQKLTLLPLENDYPECHCASQTA